MLDGRRIGSTPLALQVSHGLHTLVLSHPYAIDEQRQLSVDADIAMNVNMWLRRPTAMLLRPAYPARASPMRRFWKTDDSPYRWLDQA